MLLVKTLSVVLHIITAAAYFGLGLLLGRQARAFADTKLPEVGAIGGRSVRLMTMFAVLTLVFGLVAFFLAPGGFAVYGPEFHTSISLIVILVLVQVLLVQMGWGAMHDAIGAGTDPSSGRKRVMMGVGIAHLLWLVILVLMLWNRSIYPRFSEVLAG